MRKLVIAVLILFTSSARCYAQTPELLKRIATSQTMLRLRYEHKYDSIIQIGNKIPSTDSMFLYAPYGIIAEVYFELGNQKQGFKCLIRSIENDDYYDVGSIKYMLKKYKLENDPMYQYIVRNFERLQSRYYAHLNFPILKKCLEIFNTDMRTRNLWMAANDSITKRYFDKAIVACDSINAANLLTLMQETGHFPMANEIGNSFCNAFNYSVKHYAYLIDRDTLYKYLRVSTLKGGILNWFGPAVFDKMEYDRQRPLIYGEYGNSDDYSDDDTYTYEPIRDIDMVDKRRAEFLLPPLYKAAETQKCVLPNGYNRAMQK